jgi:hypothetical protein
MNNATVTKKEYSTIKEAKEILGTMLRFSLFTKKDKEFKDTAFGILKNSFGKEPSTSYVTNLRKSWRK